MATGDPHFPQTFLKQIRPGWRLYAVVGIEQESSGRIDPEYWRLTGRGNGDRYMPVLSKFYGIVIRMLFARPLAAHFHAIYGDTELVVGVWPVKIIQGDAPRRVREMVLEWATQHQQELLAAWHRLQYGHGPLPIEPLQ